MKKAFVIFSGFNQRAVVAFLRVLKKNAIPFGIVAKSKDDSILLSRYAHDVLYIRKSLLIEPNDIKEALHEVKKKTRATELLVAPTTELLNRFFLENRQLLSNANCIIPLVNASLYKQISDKISFSRLCQEKGIKTPQEYESLKNAGFPFVAKPKYYNSKSSGKSLAPVIIKNKEEEDSFLHQFCVDEFYFQEFIEGSSKYLLYYFHSDGSIYKFSQENMVQQPGGKSMIAAISSDFHLHKDAVKYENLFLDIGFRGFVMIEIKGDAYMIEANPRFWGPAQLLLDAKSNIFEAFLHDYGFLKEKPLCKTFVASEVLYFWHGGLMETILNGETPDFHNFTETWFIEKFPIFLSADIYRREDTYSIFKQEMNLKQK